jgi:hypothetical protein
MRAALSRRSGLSALAVVLWGCGGGEGGANDPGFAPSSPDPQRNVLVMDDGFDLSVPALRGRVAAAYTIVCRPAGGGDSQVPATFEEAKARALASLRNRDELCRLDRGVAAKPDPLASVFRYRDRWNRMLANNQLAESVFGATELRQIDTAIDAAFHTARFHGTATAGVIAHDNPEVRLVLVEEELGDAATIMQTFTCIKQEEVDRSVALMSDSEVHDALIAQPSSTLDEDLRAAIMEHRVGVTNESFGRLSRQALEALQRLKGCPVVDLKPYISLAGQIDQARLLAHPSPDGLLVKSAGNDHSRIDVPEDDFLCAPATTPRVVVGSYDPDGQQSSFTNYGACVDLFAPGTQVIAPIPGGWLLPLSGTSFSAPLVARLVSLDPTTFTGTAARQALLAARDGRQRIPIGRFPTGILYDPDHDAARFALRIDTGGDEPPRVSARQIRATLSFLALGR